MRQPVELILSNVRARLYDPDTSREAARSIDGWSAADKVFWAIKERGEAGANNAELVRDLKDQNIPNNSINSTCSRLRDASYIVDSGERRVGDYGKSQIVWIVADGFELSL